MSGATQSPWTVPFPREQSWDPHAEGTMIPELHPHTPHHALRLSPCPPTLRGANYPVPQGSACTVLSTDSHLAS